jgi:hypothetical protein
VASTPAGTEFFSLADEDTPLERFAPALPPAAATGHSPSAPASPAATEAGEDAPAPAHLPPFEELREALAVLEQAGHHEPPPTPASTAATDQEPLGGMD